MFHLSTLNCLTDVTKLVVRKKEYSAGWCPATEYRVQLGDCDLFTVVEESRCIHDCLFQCASPFELHFIDQDDQELIRVTRPLKSGDGIWPFNYLHTLEVRSPRDLLIGRIVQQFSLITQVYRVEDEHRNTIFNIRNKTNCFSWSSRQEYSVREATTGKNEICRIETESPPGAIECCNDTNDLAVNFSNQLDVKSKALLLSACVFFYKEYRHRPQYER